MSAHEWHLKQQLCDVGERIWIKGFCAGNEGNHSVRLGDDRILITPSGVSKGRLRPEMICTCDMDGTPIDAGTWRPSSERKVHVAIYKHRADVQSVIHSHPPHATAFAVANIPLPEGIHPEAEVFLGRVPVADYATPSTEDLPNSLLPKIGPETNSVIMGNHGTVSFSDSLEETYYKLEILDAYCRVLLLSKQLGNVNVLSNDQLAELLNIKSQFGLSDPRASCAPEGCVGAEQNAPFLSQIDVRPSTAACEGRSGPVQRSAQPASQNNGETIDEARFEQMVQSITDQIMAASNTA